MAIANNWALISKQVETADNRAAIMARITDVMLRSPALLKHSGLIQNWRQGILSASA